MRPSLTGVSLVHGLAGPVASRSREVHADAVQRGFWCCLPSVHRGECASQGASDASCRGRIRPPGAPPSLLESSQATIWSAQCRFGAEDCMRRLCGTPPAGWVLHPRTGPSRAQRGAESAVFRPPRGRGRASPHQARASGHPSRSSRPALGSWAWLYSAYIALVSLDARNARKVNNSIQSRFATSQDVRWATSLF